MKLEQQVVSLELAKKLKGLGVKQDSLLWWTSDKQVVDTNTANLKDTREIGRVLYAAFTVAELGEMLKTTDYELPQFDGDEWSAGPYFLGACKADTEADARAKILIYLLENKLIEV